MRLLHGLQVRPIPNTNVNNGQQCTVVRINDNDDSRDSNSHLENNNLPLVADAENDDDEGFSGSQNLPSQSDGESDYRNAEEEYFTDTDSDEYKDEIYDDLW